MLRLAIVLLALGVVVRAYENIPIIETEQDLKHDGNYYYTYKTGDGISHKAVGDGDEVKGAYKYTSPEGEEIEVVYKAGADGFQPTGPHIPTIPDHVLRLLEYQRTHPRVYDPYNRGL